MTAAIHTTADYDATRAWATALEQGGFDGVRYYCGHDPSHPEIGIALFGAAGEAVHPVLETVPIGDELLRTVERRLGIHVLPVP